MASYAKRGNRWRVQVTNALGKRVSATFPTKPAAEKWAQRMEAERTADRDLMRAGHTFYDKSRTVQDLLERYDETVLPTKKGEKKERLLMQAFLRNFPALADTPLVQIRTADFAEWRDKRLDQVSADSVIREMVILSHAFGIAVKEWQWLETNPVTNVRRPKAAKPRTRRPSADEIERLKYASGYADDEPPQTATARAIAAFLLACETGMRAGELCALRWTDVDIKSRIATIHKSKNGYGRQVPLTQGALRLLQQIKPVTEDSASVLDMPSASLDALFRKVRNRAALDGDTELRFHDSRREALTRLSSIYQVHELAKISGHRDVRILLNTYYAPEGTDLAAKMAEAEAGD